MSFLNKILKSFLGDKNQKDLKEVGKIVAKIKKAELIDIDLEKAFHESLAKVHALKMYENFLNQGWNTELVFETKNVLLPEIVRAITLGWASSIPYFNKKLLK